MTSLEGKLFRLELRVIHSGRKKQLFASAKDDGCGAWS